MRQSVRKRGKRQTPAQRFKAATDAYTAAADAYDKAAGPNGETAHEAGNLLIAVTVEACLYQHARQVFRRCAPKQYVEWLEQREDYLSRMLAAATGRNW